MDMYFRRPNFSLFTSQARYNLTKEEEEFLENAHLDVDVADEIDTDEVDHFTSLNADTHCATSWSEEDYPLEVQ